MRIYLASVNLGDKPTARKIRSRLFSYWELKENLFYANDCFTQLIQHNEDLSRSNRPRQ